MINKYSNKYILASFQYLPISTTFLPCDINKIFYNKWGQAAIEAPATANVKMSLHNQYEILCKA